MSDFYICRRKVWLLLSLLASLIVLTSCEQSTPQLKTESLNLGLAMQPASALMMVALDQELFKAQGLDIVVKEYPSGKRALREGLFTGGVDVASTADVPLTFAAFERDDFRIIASLFSASNVNRIVSRRDHGITKATDLKNKRMATQKASAVHFFMHLFLLENGISGKDVLVSFMKAEQLPKALANGEVDAFSMREPYVSEARSLLGDQAMVMSAPGAYEQMELLVATTTLLQERPVVAKRMLKALLQAEAFIHEQLDKAAEIVAKRLQVDATKIKTVLPQYTLRVSMEQSLLLLLEDQARWAIENDLLKGRVPDYLKLIHFDELLQLAPERVTIIR